MQDRTSLIYALLLVGALAASPLSAALVSFVTGTVTSPEDLNDGEEVGRGTVVRTGSDGLVMIRYEWRSDVPSRNCVLLAIFGYGQSYTVSESETPGRCATTVPSNLDSLSPGEAFLEREIRYGGAKFDEGQTSPKVTRAASDWRGFDQWLTNAERSFSGTVTAVDQRTIRVRGSRTGAERRFDLSSSTRVTPAPASGLQGRRVRVDYRGQSFRAQALRVTATDSVSPEPQVDPSTIETRPRTDHEEVLKQRAAEAELERKRRAAEEKEREKEKEKARKEREKEKAASVEDWKCSLDLHQGDTGSLSLTRKGTAIDGSTWISRGPQEHRISGTWTGEAIRFRRTLSPATSHQDFVGVAAVDSKDGTVRMAGRFAAGFRGIWSADCELAR